MFECDHKKNIKCKKASCFYTGAGTCTRTSNPTYAKRDKVMSSLEETRAEIQDKDAALKDDAVLK